jgi:hypothetical protein
MSAYRKCLHISYTREIHDFLSHLKNPVHDELSVRDLNEKLKALIQPVGFDNTEWGLFLVWRENRQSVDIDWNLKQLRTYPPRTFEFRIIVATSMSIDPFDI